MNRNATKEELASVALSLFRKDFFGIYHGSISAKVDVNRFIINRQNAIFDNVNEKNLIELDFKQDYRWKSASMDAAIHHNIYTQISEAKYITFSMPPYTTSLATRSDTFNPQDFFGLTELGAMNVYNPKTFDDWYERAQTEIPHYLSSENTNIMIIRGYGVFAFSRDLHDMAKRLAVLEKSCRIIMLDLASDTQQD